MAITKAQMSRLQRRQGGGIDRLTKDYKRSLDTLMGEYGSAFSAYGKRIGEQMIPYDAAIKGYQQQSNAYLDQVDAYNKKLIERQNLIQNISERPTETVGASFRGDYVSIGGVEYKKNKLPPEYFIDKDFRGQKAVFRNREIPEMTEAAPMAPAAPELPPQEVFDDSKFKAKRAELATSYQREVSERKAARLGAVGRRSTRTLLQGV
jgi:hypothetical protein